MLNTSRKQSVGNGRPVTLRPFAAGRSEVLRVRLSAKEWGYFESLRDLIRHDIPQANVPPGDQGTRRVLKVWCEEALRDMRELLGVEAESVRAWAEIRCQDPGIRPKVSQRASRLGVGVDISRQRFAEFLFSERADRRIATIREHYRGRFPKIEFQKMLVLQDGKCAYCGVLLGDDFHVDHRMPVSRGGSDEIENLCCACPPCNLRKSTMTAEEFLARHLTPVSVTVKM